MSKTYVFNENPFQDILVDAIMNGVDISHPQTLPDLYTIFANIIENNLENEKDVVLLDFDIENNNGYYRLVPKNIISAFWLLNMFPENPKYHSKSDTIIVENVEYTFNKKTCQLTIKNV